MKFVIAAVGGLLVGSFLNVVAYRLPRHESLLTPGSHCPGCSAPVKPYDNIPVLGWLLLRGRCRACGERISVRYPLVELASALLAVSVVLAKHGAHETALGLVLVAVLVPVSLIDLDHRIIPNRITGPAAIGAVVIGLITHPAGVPTQLLWGAAGGGFLLVFALAYPAGLGMGDVKLAAVLGLYLGNSVVVALFAGILASAVLGLGVIARLGVSRGRKTGVPLGPFLALGGVVALLAGPSVVHWYVHSVMR